MIRLYRRGNPHVRIIGSLSPLASKLWEEASSSGKALALTVAKGQTEETLAYRIEQFQRAMAALHNYISKLERGNQ